MPDSVIPRVAIVDCGMGNLFSVRQACEAAGLQPSLTSEAHVVRAADGVILPGVGAFGDAMKALQRGHLDEALREAVSEGKPLIGICLGMQLLFDESEEFGSHRGLGFVRGAVRRFPARRSDGAVLKVPEVGWNRLERPRGRSWNDSALTGLQDGEFMYFVHSYYVQPEREDLVLATSRYGGVTFCSAVQDGHVIGLQCHPERSGPRGLEVYANLAAIIRQTMEARSNA